MQIQYFNGKVTVLVIILLVLFPSGGNCQEIDFNNYQTIVSSGSLPEEFATTSTEKYLESKKTISGKDNRKTRRAKKEFYLEAAFSIDNILKSGQVLFNDPVGIYVNKVFNKILETETGLDRKVKVFVVKTQYSNAFATDQGIIFITTGLLARLKNEAQLAFVLCHELVHFKKKHSMDIFLSQKIKTREELKQDGGFSDEDELLSQAAYSKEKETEADLEGLDIYLKTGYNPAEAVNVFDVLHYSHLPFDSIKVENIFFDSENLVWPESYFLESLTPVFAEEEDNDSLSTHPNTYKRKQALSALIEKNSRNGSDFLVSESEFKYIRKISRFELSRQALIKRNYCEAVYTALLLQKEHPESKYLKKVIAKSLLGIAAYLNGNSRNKLKINYKKVQGDIQQLYYFFSQLRNREACVLALEYTFRIKNEYPDDIEIKNLLDKGFYYLTKHYKKVGDFKTESLPDTLNSKLAREKLNDGDSLVKLKSIPQDAFKYAFSSYRADPVFDELFTANVAARKDEDELIPGKKISNRKIKKQEGEKVIFLSPFHYSVDERKEKPIKLDDNEQKILKFIKDIEISATAANLPYEVLSELKLDTSDAEELNNLALLKDWLSENLADGDIDILPTDFERINELSQKLKTRYICLVGHIHLIEKKTDAWFFVTASILMPVISWPFTVPYFVFRQQVNATFMLTLDLKTGKVVNTNYNALSTRDKEYLTLSNLYDFMLKVKKYQFENK